MASSSSLPYQLESAIEDIESKSGPKVEGATSRVQSLLVDDSMEASLEHAINHRRLKPRQIQLTAMAGSSTYHWLVAA